MHHVRNMPTQHVRLNGPQNEDDDVQMALQQNHVPFVATLLLLPGRTLYVLWQEYETGIWGGKPARHISATESGQVKYNYTIMAKRFFLEVVAYPVCAGYTAQVAIDRIYNAYGMNMSFGAIINRVMQDLPLDGHPELHIWICSLHFNFSA